jgi:hypothetical protein
MTDKDGRRLFAALMEAHTHTRIAEVRIGTVEGVATVDTALLGRFQPCPGDRTTVRICADVDGFWVDLVLADGSVALNVRLEGYVSRSEGDTVVEYAVQGATLEFVTGPPQEATGTPRVTLTGRLVREGDQFMFEESSGGRPRRWRYHRGPRAECFGNRW